MMEILPKSLKTQLGEKSTKFISKVKLIWWTLIRWIVPQWAEVKMDLSEPLPDGNYITGTTGRNIKIKHGKIYRLE